MELTPGNLIVQAIETIREPQKGARRVMALNLTRRQRWEILALIAVLSALLAQVSVLVEGGAVEIGGLALASGLEVLLVLGAQLLGTVLAVYLIGRMFGGQGTLDDAIMLVSWLQFILISLQAVQIVLALVLPPLAFMLGLVGLVLLFYLLTNFITEMHRFQSRAKVFIGILISMVALAVPFAIVLRMLGFDVSGG